VPARVLSLDPGERVGWARADVHEDGTWTDLRHGITPLRDMAIAVADSFGIAAEYFSKSDVCGGSEYDVVIVEDWRLRPAEAKHFVGSSFPSVQFIGAVRLCCWLSGTKLVMQGASTKKTADKSMAALRPDLYAKVTTPRAHDDAHDMDAIRHLWFHTFKHYPVEIRKEAA
jgi:hypothetical protein